MLGIRRYSVFWAVLLISFGGLALLSSLGLFRINIWNLMFPAFLIFWGLWVLIGMFSHSGTYHRKSEPVNIPIDGAERAHIRLDHRVGRLHVSSGAPGGQLFNGTFDVDVDVRRDNGTLDVNMSGTRDIWSRMFNSQNWWGCVRRNMWSRRSNHWNWRQRGSHGTWPRMFGPWSWHWSGSHDWNLALNHNVPIELSVDTRFSETQLDLSEIRVTDLKLKTNMSTSVVTLPRNSGHIRTRLRDTMSEIKVHVPEGVAARICVTGGWENVSVNEDRFPRNGDVYQSPDYDTSENKVEIDATSDMGMLRIV